LNGDIGSFGIESRTSGYMATGHKAALFQRSASFRSRPSTIPQLRARVAASTALKMVPTGLAEIDRVSKLVAAITAALPGGSGDVTDIVGASVERTEPKASEIVELVVHANHRYNNDSTGTLPEHSVE
jgi:hypothetical protein